MASPVPKPRGGTEMRSQSPKCRPCQGMTPTQAPGPSAKWPENFRHRRWQSVVPEQLRHRHWQRPQTGPRWGARAPVTGVPGFSPWNRPSRGLRVTFGERAAQGQPLPGAQAGSRMGAPLLDPQGELEPTREQH